MPKGSTQVAACVTGRDEPDIFVAVVSYVVHITDAIALSWQIALGLHVPFEEAPLPGSVRHLSVIPLAYDIVVLERFKDASEAKSAPEHRSDRGGWPYPFPQCHRNAPVRRRG